MGVGPGVRWPDVRFPSPSLFFSVSGDKVGVWGIPARIKIQSSTLRSVSRDKPAFNQKVFSSEAAPELRDCRAQRALSCRSLPSSIDVPSATAGPGSCVAADPPKSNLSIQTRPFFTGWNRLQLWALTIYTNQRVIRHIPLNFYI